MSNNFSVLMSLYHKEKPQYLGSCLESIFEQSLTPAELVIIKDGPIGKELDDVIKKFQLNKGDVIKVVEIKENVGLGKALKLGVTKCKFDIIARVDTDDICFNHRFETQIKYMVENPEVDVTGSWVSEFADSIKTIEFVKKVPEIDSDIKKFHKQRNALNHMSVAFRKNKVLEAGSYIDMPCFEDYFLWARMMLLEHRFYNFQESLMYARIGNDMIGRRHGYNYAIKEFHLFKKLVEIRFIGYERFITALLFRIPLRLIPKYFLEKIYKVIRRKS